MQSWIAGALFAAGAVAAATVWAAAPELTAGEIRKVDLAGQKVTIAHGEIKNLQMPPMTMVFQVRDAAWLRKLKAGDRVRFAADKLNGGYVVTDLRPEP